MVRAEGSTGKPKDPLLVKYERIKQASAALREAQKAAQASGTPVPPITPSEPYEDTTPKGLGTDSGSFGGE